MGRRITLPRIGARAEPGDWVSTNALIGPLAATRIYEVELPTGLDRKGIPVGPELWISYRGNTDAALQQYLLSIPAGEPVVIIPGKHEPENDALQGGTWSPTQHWAELTQARRVLAQINRPLIRIAFVSAGAVYDDPQPGDNWPVGSDPINGDWVPPLGSVDLIGTDTYQTSLNQMKPIYKDPRFRNWWRLFAPHLAMGVPFCIPEYGRGHIVAGETDYAAKEAKRQQILADDAVWLSDLPHFALWEYFYALGKTVVPNKEWRFADSTSINLWKGFAQSGL